MFCQIVIAIFDDSDSTYLTAFRMSSNTTTMKGAQQLVATGFFHSFSLSYLMCYHLCGYTVKSKCGYIGTYAESEHWPLGWFFFSFLCLFYFIIGLPRIPYCNAAELQSSNSIILEIWDSLRATRMASSWLVLTLIICGKPGIFEKWT